MATYRLIPVTALHHLILMGVNALDYWWTYSEHWSIVEKVKTKWEQPIKIANLGLKKICVTMVYMLMF